MRKSKIFICICMVSILAIMLFPNLNISSATQSQSPKYVEGEVIVGFKPGAAALSVVSQSGASVKNEVSKLNAFVVRVAPGKEDAYVANMKTNPAVAFVERNGIGEAAFIPNDTNWGLLWNMPMIKADKAWDTYRGSTEVIIAILDTGINYSHADLAANYMPGGYDWAYNDFDPMDGHNHGTHCAGIAAAVMNNALGVAGVAQVKVWAEKILTDTGNGAVDDLASGIVHATDKGVKVISMSLQNYPYSTLVENAVNYAYSKGVILVAAAGNAHRDIDTSPSYPASYTNVIAVSATNSADNFDSSYSNYGDKIEVSAPGTDIYSTISVVPNGYTYMTGTSMACPHVAGLAALIWSYKPHLTNGQVRTALHTSVDDKGPAGKDEQYGYGRINCQKAISSPETYQYKFSLSGFTDRVYVNVTPKTGGYLINGKVNVSSGPHQNYPAPVLGWASGNDFYMTFDYRKTASSFDLGFLVGTISTRSGKLYRTNDGATWTGPTAVTLNPFTAIAEEQANAASIAEIATVQFVEGYNTGGTAAPGILFTGGWYGLQYTPSVSYPLKKVEFMTGEKTGPFVVQLRPDNGSGYPSNTVYRQVTFTMSNTLGWQGAEFPTSYIVSAGTTYWIVIQPVALARFSGATSGTLYTHTWDNFGTGTGWDTKVTTFPWMAKFYREVQPTFQYRFNVNPFPDKAYVNVTSQTGGMLIYGLANVTGTASGYPAPILGWGTGNSFFMPFDYRTEIGSGNYELGFLIGTISTASGNLYRTKDGTSPVGPTAVALAPFVATDDKGKPSATT